MKKFIVILLLIIEFAGILAIALCLAKDKASRCSDAIQFPKDMQLTLDNDMSFDKDSGVIFIPKGTKIIPGSNYDDSIHFMIEGSDEMLSATWDNFVEQDHLIALKEEARQKQVRNQNAIMKRGAIRGGIAGGAWLLIGSLISFILLKKNKSTLSIISFSLLSAVIIFFVVITSSTF